MNVGPSLGSRFYYFILVLRSKLFNIIPPFSSFLNSFAILGGFAPNILENKEALELIKAAVAKAGFTDQIKIGMDVAASEFCKEGPKYDLDFKNPNSDPKDWLSPAQLAKLYQVGVSLFMLGLLLFDCLVSKLAM